MTSWRTDCRETKAETGKPGDRGSDPCGERQWLETGALRMDGCIRYGTEAQFSGPAHYACERRQKEGASMTLWLHSWVVRR